MYCTGENGKGHWRVCVGGEIEELPLQRDWKEWVGCNFKYSSYSRSPWEDNIQANT